MGLGALLIVLGGVWFFSNSRPSKPSQPAAVNLSSEVAKVDIKANQFISGTIKIKPGTTVTWTNKDTKPHRIAADPHPAHDSSPGLLSDDLNKGDSYSYVFEKTGTFTYHDELQPFKLHGTVIVSE